MDNQAFGPLMALSPKQWQQAGELFHTALDTTPELRAQLVHKASLQDQGVATEAQRLLANHDAVGNALDPPCMLPRQISEELVNKRIGSFRLLRPIAAGGMATVWLGERADAPFRQRVAIKLMNVGLTSTSLNERFERERRALALLEHHSITRLIDGGTSENGLPYLVMEYVEGKPIDSYCDTRRLSIRQRLTLFRLVCEVVEYAHQNLIVHRDLKPSNILVSADGRPKLLDFGIAKLLHHASGENGVDVTRTLLHPLTPRYASPEQLCGGRITTATDVFSLGVILYELLSGHRPCGSQALFDGSWEHIVRDNETLAPSAVIGRLDGFAVEARDVDTPTPNVVAAFRRESSRSLRRYLRGDLDNIAMMAMHQDLGRRYPSVRALSEDIQRFLKGHPVFARRSTVRYRIAKFVKRRRSAVFAATVAFVALLFGSIGTVASVRRVRAERDAAVRLTDFLEEMMRSASPFRASEDRSIYTSLKETERRIEHEMADLPAVEARVRMALARTYEELWRWPETETNARIALDLNQQMYGDNHAVVADALLVLGRALASLRKPEAVGIHERALSWGVDSLVLSAPWIATAKSGLAYALWHGARPPEWEKAEKLYREAIAIYERSPDAAPHDLAMTFNEMARMFRAQGRLGPRTDAFFQRARELYNTEPVHHDRAMAECMRQYAEYLNRVGRYEEEADALEEYLARIPRIFAAYSSVLDSTWRVAELRYRFADLDASERQYRQSLKTECNTRACAWPDHASRLRPLERAFANEAGLSRLATSVEAFLLVLPQVVNPADKSLSWAMVDLSVMMCREGYDGEGDSVLRALTTYHEGRWPDDEWLRAYTRNAQGACLLEQGRTTEAKPLLVSTSTMLRYRSPMRGARSKAFRRLIQLYDALGKPRKADTYRALLAEDAARRARSRG